MNDFSQKISVSDEDFMTYIRNNLLKEYGVILDRLEYCLIANGHSALTIDTIPEYFHFNNFLGREREASSLQCKNLVKYLSPTTWITHIGLANQGTPGF